MENRFQYFLNKELEIERKINTLEKEKGDKIQKMYYVRSAQIRDLISHLKKELEDIRNKKRL